MKSLACLVLALVMIPLGVNAPLQGGVRIYKSCHENKEQIAITFDDGPHPRYTEQILDILKENNIKATFFIIGENVELYGDGIIKRIIEEGHEIGNHTFTHPHTKGAEDESFYEEVRRTHTLMLEKYGYEMKLFRPPEGYIDAKVKKIAEELGYSIVLWSVDTKDWNCTKKDTIVKNVSVHASGGDIILMHDYVSRRGYTIPALKAIIPRLKSNGLEFVTVSELVNK